ncbi:MAG: 30S ribosomal protein S17e [Vulcanisaeta sp.]|uniref:Small ribosomal subunit protein eS17 n=1 Tax=Vulcanisaeta moutnovskia (strain 768-28) TaxID=985053 RepID=F0QTQ1_VULM7|nr:30S ribosomal protein S17e [Vulcanisaeta moutnovskia]ADY00517.1 30S ribosomal protein S17e [Vulcanisaeta moutnovskia 768-28]
MGRVRPRYIKSLARRLLEVYPGRFSDDFESNKKVVAELADIPSKSVRNKVAGEITRVMKRMKAGAEEKPEIELEEQ